LRMYLDDEIGIEVYDKFTEIASKYSPEISSKQLQEIYVGYFQDRKESLKRALDSILPKNVEVLTEEK